MPTTTRGTQTRLSYEVDSGSGAETEDEAYFEETRSRSFKDWVKNVVAGIRRSIRDPEWRRDALASVFWTVVLVVFAVYKLRKNS